MEISHGFDQVCGGSYFGKGLKTNDEMPLFHADFKNLVDAKQFETMSSRHQNLLIYREKRLGKANKSSFLY